MNGGQPEHGVTSRSAINPSSCRCLWTNAPRYTTKNKLSNKGCPEILLSEAFYCMDLAINLDMTVRAISFKAMDDGRGFLRDGRMMTKMATSRY